MKVSSKIADIACKKLISNDTLVTTQVLHLLEYLLYADYWQEVILTLGISFLSTCLCAGGMGHVSCVVVALLTQYIVHITVKNMDGCTGDAIL